MYSYYAEVLGACPEKYTVHVPGLCKSVCVVCNYVPLYPTMWVGGFWSMPDGKEPYMRQLECSNKGR